MDSSVGDGESSGIPRDEIYKPYIPVKKRKALLLKALKGKHGADKKLRQEGDETLTKRTEEEEAERAKERLRKERTLLAAAQEVKEKQAEEGEYAVESLLITQMRRRIPRSWLPRKTRGYLRSSREDKRS